MPPLFVGLEFLYTSPCSVFAYPYQLTCKISPIYHVVYLLHFQASAQTFSLFYTARVLLYKNLPPIVIIVLSSDLSSCFITRWRKASLPYSLTAGLPSPSPSRHQCFLLSFLPPLSSGLRGKLRLTTHKFLFRVRTNFACLLHVQL
jgi:hypothetical protein